MLGLNYSAVRRTKAKFVTETHLCTLIVSITLSSDAEWVLIVQAQRSVFKSTVFVFPIISLLAFNIVILILGPTVLVLLVVWKRVINARQYENGNLQRSRARALQFRHFTHDSLSSNSLRQDHDDVPSIHPPRLNAIWAHSKFWIALVMTLVLQALLIVLYIVLNPFVSSKLSIFEKKEMLPQVLHAKSRQSIHLHTSSCSPSCPLLISHSVSCLHSLPHYHSTRRKSAPWHPLRKINTSLSFTYTC